MQKTFTVFGSGQVGSFVIKHLLAAGHRVRVAKRSPDGAPAGAEVLTGDAEDPAFVRRAAEGASALIHAMNPAYDRKLWARALPAYAKNLIEAALAEKARLVVLDNLYAYGPQQGRPITETTPEAPVSAKGRIRRATSDLYFEAAKTRGLDLVIGRASDFWGPEGLQTNFGDYFWKPILAGKKGQVIAPLQVAHTYHYIPDVAAGLVALATAARPADALYLLPCLPPVSLAQLILELERASGRRLPVTGMPRAMMRALGLVWPLMRELAEMQYQWDAVLTVDDARFRAEFPAVQPTPMPEGAAATWAWAKARYGFAA